MPNVSMRQAQPEDLKVVMVLVTEVSAWLAERGIEQWPSPPAPEVHRLLARGIGVGEVCLAERNDTREGIGLLRFEWHDADLWPNDPDGGGYVHSFLVLPAYHGQAIGSDMLTWAADHARGRGRRFLRLDSVAGNDR